MAEELLTVNDEMKASVAELAQAKGDLENLIVSTEIATLFLDRDLAIKWFTPQVRSLFHVRTTDVGRPLADLAQRFGDARLVDDVEAVLDRLQVTEREVQAEDGRWYLVHVRPYRTTSDHIDGVVVTFVDITERRRTEAAVQASAARATFRADFADAVRPLTDPGDVKAMATRLLGRHLGASRVHYGEVDDEAFVVVDRDYTDGVESLAGRLRMDIFNPALARAHDAGQILVTPDLAHDAELSDADRAAYAAVGVAAQICAPLVKGKRLVAVLAVYQAAPRAWTPHEVALVEETAERTWSAVERRRADAALRESEARFRALTSATSNVLYRMSPDWSEMRQLDGDGFLADTDLPRRDWADGYLHADDRALVDAAIAEAVRTRGVFELEHRVWRADGTLGWTFSRAVPLLGEHGEVVEWFGAASDITEKRRAAEEIETLNATLEARVAERTQEVRRLAARLTVAEQEERQRIAHVLHDDLQQQLYGLSSLLTVFARDPAAEGAGALARRAVEIVGTATEMARSLATELSPAILQADRLEDLLAWTAEATRATYGLTTEVDVRDAPRVADPALRILLYQLLREVLFNVVKHSGVTQARLAAWTEGDYAVVRVGDDGAGFDVGAVDERRSGGFGLSSVRERIGLVGGRSEVESAPGQGTRVTLFVPSGDPAPG